MAKLETKKRTTHAHGAKPPKLEWLLALHVRVKTFVQPELVY
jgi:hypothetical protein